MSLHSDVFNLNGHVSKSNFLNEWRSPDHVLIEIKLFNPEGWLQWSIYIIQHIINFKNSLTVGCPVPFSGGGLFISYESYVWGLGGSAVDL